MTGDKTPPTDGRMPSPDGDVAAMVAFLDVLFELGDTITLRPIEAWTLRQSQSRRARCRIRDGNRRDAK